MRIPSTIYRLSLLLVPSLASSSSWELVNKRAYLNLTHIPFSEEGNASRLSTVSDALCDLTANLKIRFICCVSFLVKQETSTRPATLPERIHIWANKFSTLGDHCVNTDNHYPTLRLPSGSRLCQVLFCHLTGQRTKHCREGCVYCDSPCRKRYLPMLYFGW